MSIEKVLKISCSNSIVFDSINVDGWQHQFVVSPLTSHYIHCEMNPSNFDFSRGKFNIYLIIILVYRTLSTSGARYAWVGFRRFYQMPIHSISIGISHRTLFFSSAAKNSFFFVCELEKLLLLCSYRCSSKCHPFSARSFVLPPAMTLIKNVF